MLFQILQMYRTMPNKTNYLEYINNCCYIIPPMVKTYMKNHKDLKYQPRTIIDEDDSYKLMLTTWASYDIYNVNSYSNRECFLMPLTYPLYKFENNNMTKCLSNNIFHHITHDKMFNKVINPRTFHNISLQMYIDSTYFEDDTKKGNGIDILNER